MSSLPPLSSSGVFSVSASSSIDAPLEKVWSILLDFPSYKKWQEFNVYFLLARSELIFIASRNSFVYENTPCPEINPLSYFFFDRRSQTVVNASNETIADQTPVEGSFLQIKVNIPPTMDEPGFLGKSSVFVKVKTIDHINHRAAWGAEALPKFLLHTERWQALSEDEATGRTKYETIEVFSGILAYFVKFFVGKNLALSFQAGADCLKKCAEGSSPL